MACFVVLLGGAVVSGCEESDSPPAIPAGPSVDAGCDFDPATAGTLAGNVTWDGVIPKVAIYRAPISPGMEQSGGSRREWPNPNAPHIHPDSKAVAGAVVFLRGVDAHRGRPWDHPPVRVELSDYQIHIYQGDTESPCGFVRRGAVAAMVSRQTVFHSLRVRGAAYFSRAFPDRDQPCSERFDRSGVVELSSGCGYFWMRGYLFADDHPYYTRTNAEGCFALPLVPPGTYELVCWMPDWHEAGHELDAETALVCRLNFRPPIEVIQSIRLSPGETRTVPIRVPAERFGR